MTSSIIDESESVLLSTEEDRPPQRHMSELTLSSGSPVEEVVDNDVIVTSTDHNVTERVDKEVVQTREVVETSEVEEASKELVTITTVDGVDSAEEEKVREIVSDVPQSEKEEVVETEEFVVVSKEEITTETKPESEPVTQQAVDPVAEQALQQVVEPVTEQAAQQVSEPVGQQAVEAVTEQVSQVVEPIVEQDVESVAEKTVQPVAQSVSTVPVVEDNVADNDEWRQKRNALTPKRQQFFEDDEKRLQADELKQDQIVLWKLHRDELALQREEFFKKDANKQEDLLSVTKKVLAETEQQAVESPTAEKEITRVSSTEKVEEEQENDKIKEMPVANEADSSPETTAEPLTLSENVKEEHETVDSLRGTTVEPSTPTDKVKEEHETVETTVESTVESSTDEIKEGESEQEDDKVVKELSSVKDVTVSNVEIEDSNHIQQEGDDEDASVEQRREPEVIRAEPVHILEISSNNGVEEISEEKLPQAAGEPESKQEEDVKSKQEDTTEDVIAQDQTEKLTTGPLQQKSDSVDLESTKADKTYTTEDRYVEDQKDVESTQTEEAIIAESHFMRDQKEKMDTKPLQQKPDQVDVESKQNSAVERLQLADDKDENQNLCVLNQTESQNIMKSPREKREDVINQAFDNLNKAIVDAKQQIIEIEKIPEEEESILHTTPTEQVMEVSDQPSSSVVSSVRPKPTRSVVLIEQTERIPEDENRNDIEPSPTIETAEPVAEAVEETENENVLSIADQTDDPVENNTAPSQENHSEVQTTPSDEMEGRLRSSTVPPVAQSTPTTEFRVRSQTFVRRRKDSLSDSSSKGDASRDEEIATIAQLIAFKQNMEEKEQNEADLELLAFKAQVDNDVIESNVLETSYSVNDDGIEGGKQNERPDSAIVAFRKELEIEVEKENAVEVSVIADEDGEENVENDNNNIQNQPEKVETTLNADSGIVDETFDQTYVEESINETLQQQTEAVETEPLSIAELASGGDTDVKTHVTEVDSHSGSIQDLYVVNKAHDSYNNKNESPVPLRVASLRSLKMETDDSQQQQTHDDATTVTQQQDLAGNISLNLSTLKSIGGDSESELPKDTSYSESHMTTDDEENLVARLPIDNPTATQNELKPVKKKISESSNFSFTGSSVQPSEEEGVITYTRVPPDQTLHPSDHHTGYIDDEISYTDASFSEAEGVIHYQRLPPDHFKTALAHQSDSLMQPADRDHIPTSPILLDSQPQKYTIDKKIVSTTPLIRNGKEN